MKQIFLFLSAIYSTALISQTVLTSYPIDLKNKIEESEVFTAENSVTHEVFACIASDSLTILKYNSALFLKDTFTDARRYSEKKTLLGYSFSEDTNPTLYWFSPESRNIIIIKYYFETKTSKALKFDFPSNQFLIGYYQKDNIFYLLLQHENKPALTAFVFKNGAVEERFLDFSSFTFIDKKTQPRTFNQILKENPIEKMDSGEYNPLYKVAAKTKIYTLPNRLILTFDQSFRKTQLFDINLDNLEIKEKIFMKPIGQKNPKTSNSYYHENKLYQININSEELLFDIKDYNSGESLKAFSVSKNDTIKFTNSPLLLQIENRKPKELKNTSKFLKQVSSLNAGISVYKNKTNLFLTLGGIGSNSQTFSTNNFDDFFNDFPSNNRYSIDTNYSVFFESIWDKNFGLTHESQKPLASDKIFYFLDNHREISLLHILKLRDYSILNYYDNLSKKIILRKFDDGWN